MEQGVYPPGWLDFGLGLAPGLCGKGLGGEFVRLGMEFGRERFSAGQFRLSVACFNRRAIKVYERCGFTAVQEVTNSYFQNRFLIMTAGERP